MIFVKLDQWSMQSQYVKACHFSFRWSLIQSSNCRFLHKGQTPKIPNHVQVNLSKALPKTGTIDDTFTSGSQTKKEPRNRSVSTSDANLDLDQNALLYIHLWCYHVHQHRASPILQWKSRNEEKAGKGYKNNRTKLNDKLKNLKQNNQLWETQFSQFSRETGDIFFLVRLVQFVHCQCDSWAPQHWDELLHDPMYSLQLCFG